MCLFFILLEALKTGKHSDRNVTEFQVVIEAYVRRTTERIAALKEKNKKRELAAQSKALKALKNQEIVAYYTSKNSEEEDGKSG